jgi:PRTRC genetic system ThiF family protein
MSRQSVQISYDRLNAVPVILASHKHLHLYLVGVGGTGGWLAPTLVRLTKILTDQGRSVSLTLIDYDHVEKVNIPRQNFTQADLGLNKAQVLALRYGMAYGVDVMAIPDRFNPEMVTVDYNTLSLVIGCVDNSAARIAIAKALDENHPNTMPRVWWLDGGNTRTQGQVLFGCWSELRQNPSLYAHLSQAPNSTGSPLGCVNLPGPSLQHPELLEPRAEELADHILSCAELASRNAQSLLVNQRVAVELGEYLVELLLVKSLRRFATYFDLEMGASCSRFTAPETLDTFVIERENQCVRGSQGRAA